MISKAKLASLTVAGASAIVLTSGKAQADTIIVSAVLDTTIGFGDTTLSRSGATNFDRVFDTFASGPRFTLSAFSERVAGNYARAINALGAIFQLSSGNAIGKYGAGAEFVAGRSFSQVIASRAWGIAGTHTAGGPSYTNEYLLFQFTKNSVLEYGWIETSLSITNEGSSLGSLGPTLTIQQYAFGTDGAQIAAGQLPPPTPEPSSLAKSGLAALILGAEGLRRWRKARRAA